MDLQLYPISVNVAYVLLNPEENAIVVLMDLEGLNSVGSLKNSSLNEKDARILLYDKNLLRRLINCPRENYVKGRVLGHFMSSSASRI